TRPVRRTEYPRTAWYHRRPDRTRPALAGGPGAAPAGWRAADAAALPAGRGDWRAAGGGGARRDGHAGLLAGIASIQRGRAADAFGRCGPICPELSGVAWAQRRRSRGVCGWSG